jgi:hypothetical protein
MRLPGRVSRRARQLVTLQRREARRKFREVQMAANAHFSSCKARIASRINKKNMRKYLR